jgi:hypothetical protein
MKCICLTRKRPRVMNTRAASTFLEKCNNQEQLNREKFLSAINRTTVSLCCSLTAPFGPAPYFLGQVCLPILMPTRLARLCLLSSRISSRRWLNRIQPQHAPCATCAHIHMKLLTIISLSAHHLIVSGKDLFLQDQINRTLYGTSQELTNTCIYHYLALSQRAKAHRLLDQ